MKIAIGADHHGVTLKSHLINVNTMSVEWIDCGCSQSLCDYPLQAVAVVDYIRSHTCVFGVLLCGTGVGMAIAANRFKGIYAALAWTPEIARLSRQHDNANILVIPADYVSLLQATSIVEAWMSASFEGGRHLRRIDQIDALGGV